MKAMAATVRATALLLLAAVAAAASAATPVSVTFDSKDGTPLRAWLFQPAATSARGMVVALHGCGGLYTAASAKGNAPRFTARHQGMADMLVEEGYSVVFPDSLLPRGETSLCTQVIGSRRITQRERRADALAALTWAAAQPGVSPARIAVLGWSHGGSAVLAAIDSSRPEVRGQAVQPALAVAFYPGCSDALRSGWRTEVPLAMMLGEDDDWTPPAPCVALGRAAGAEVNVYAASHHGFDNPVGRLQHLPEVPNGVRPGQGVHVGPNPVAREQAYGRLRERLRQAFGAADR